MKAGATSFVFRYLLMDPRSVRLDEVLDRASQSGIERFQICENASPLELSPVEWELFLEKARDLKVEISLGCKTLDPAVLECYSERASRIPSGTMRVVLEDEYGPPSKERISSFLKQAVRVVERYGMRLAIENHFDVSARQLVAAVQPYPREIVGFCLDAANSLRRFESVDYVFESLGPRAYCYHLKDFKVIGSNVGFAVAGAPLGRGDLDLDWVFGVLQEKDLDPEVYLETWVAPSGVREKDIQTDSEWLSDSLQTLRDRSLRWGL